MAQLLTPVGLLFVLGGGGEPGEANLAMTAACNPARQISFSGYGFLIALGALHLQRVPSTFKLASRVKGRVFVEKPCVAGISVQVCSGAPVWAQHTMPALSCPRTRLSVLLGVSGPVGGYNRAPLSYVVLQT